MYDLIVIGGGAAGFFTAIQLAERRSDAKILILEKSNKVLAKVKVSGGGRCNVTHACFIPSDMIDHYPRGNKELLGPFHRFLCGDMMAWLSEQGVETKIEEDGRVFPVSDSSESIIACFMKLCTKYNIEIQMHCGLEGLVHQQEAWTISSTQGTYQAKSIMLSTGSTPSVWKLMAGMGYEIVEPVPSLFTFNIKSKLLEELQGLSMPQAIVQILGTDFSASGPLLITHWGLSGPAILKLSSWAARDLHQLDYEFTIQIDWLGMDVEELRNTLEDQKNNAGKRTVKKHPLFGMPRRLWESFCYEAILREDNYGSMTSVQIDALIKTLSASTFEVKGKSTFKEEFVTCGGIERKQIDFKSMQSKIHPGLYMAGEVLDIDAITGGFNFQAAWTEAFIAAEDIAGKD
jgi:predicted Rossmann fold flavoprotein